MKVTATTERNPSRQNPGVIDHEQVPGSQEIRQVHHATVLDPVAVIDE